MRTSPLPRSLSALAALWLAASAMGAMPADATAPALVVLGDSLSAGYGIRPEEGWVALLQRRLESEGYGYQVVNASVSGETTSGGLARLPRVLASHRPAILLVELGANDGLRGLPLGEMQSNLEHILATAREAHAAVVMIGMQIPANYGAEYTSRFAATFPAVAKSGRAGLVPFLLARVALDEANFQADRLHPIAKVQDKLLDTVWPVLKPLLHASPRAPAAATAVTH